jgi:hypothetical protein
MAGLTWESELTCPTCGNELELLTQATRTSKDHIAVFQCKADQCKEPWVLERKLSMMNTKQRR